MANNLASPPKLNCRGNYAEITFAVENLLKLDGLKAGQDGTEYIDAKMAQA